MTSPPGRLRRTVRALTARHARHARDAGTLELFCAVMVVGLFLLIGLIVDGSGKLNAAARADSLAQEAARAGGQRIDAAEAISGDGIVVDPEAAAKAAEDYLAAAGTQGSVTVSDNGETLTVTVHDSYTTRFPGPYATMPVHATGTAHLRTQAGD